MSRRARVLGIGAMLLALAGCEREVIVQSDGASTALPPVMPWPGPPGPAGVGGIGGTGGTGGTGGIIGVPTAGVSGDPAAGGAAGMTAPQGGMDQPPPLAGLLAGIDQAGVQGSAALQDFDVVSDALTSIERPAVGSGGVTLLQFQGASRALTLNVHWNHGTERWYGSSGAYAGYNAAHLEQHYSLLYAEAYGIYANGSEAELSGDAATYKEFLAASAAGIAWVDYPVMPSPAAAAPMAAEYGEIVLLRSEGGRSVLSDRSRYRASVALSQQHIAFIEYASTEPGSVGQVMLQDLAGGAPFAVAASAHHQDKPALDGEWLVFEEYLSADSSVIRAYNLVTAELRELSPSTGFRTHADVRGTKVVWEDYRNGSGDIYGMDLATGAEQPLISGRGHSAVPRLIEDGLVWVESLDSGLGLLRARWR